MLKGLGGLGGLGDMAKLMKQAQEMQTKMVNVQAQMQAKIAQRRQKRKLSLPPSSSEE